MTGRKAVKISVLSLLAIVVLLIIFLAAFNFGYFKPSVEALISKATGRAFVIEGDLSLKVLPRPHLSIENAQLANPKWSNEANMLRVGSASVTLELMSLLRAPLVISELTLEDIELNLETGPNDSGNWQFTPEGQTDEVAAEEPPAPPSKPSDPLQPPVTIRHAQLKNIAISYQQSADNLQRFLLESLTISPDENSGARVHSNATLNELALALQGRVSAESAELEATINELTTQATLNYTAAALAFELAIDSLADVGNLLDKPDLPQETLQISGNIGLHKNTLVVDAFKLALPDINISTEGEYQMATGQARFSIAAQAASANKLHPTLPTLPLTLTSELNLKEQLIALTPFNITLADYGLKGTVQLNTREKPTLTLEAHSALIDLAALSPPQQENETSAQPAPQHKTGYVFSGEPLDLTGLDALNADIKISVDHLKTTNAQVKEFALDAKLLNSLLTLDNRFTGEAGGRYHSQVTLDASDETAKVNLESRVEAFKLAALSGPDVPDSDIPETSLAVNLQAVGSSPRALAASLDGSVLLNQGPGKVNNDLIEKFSGDILAQLLNTLNPLAKTEKFTDWDCSIIAINFVSGLGEINGFLLQSQKLMVVGGGEIDLNTEKLGFEFNTKPRKGVGVSADMFVTPFVKLSGTLAEPAIGLNKKGVLLSGGAAVLTGGMSFLYTGLMDRAMAEGSRCEKVLEMTQEPLNSDTFPQP